VEAIGDADGPDDGGEPAGRESGPMLVLKVGANIDGAIYVVVGASTDGEHVVSEVCDTVLVVEDSSSDHYLSVWREAAIVAVVAYPDLVCFFVEVLGRGVLEETEVELGSQVRDEVKVRVGGDSFEFFGGVIGVGEAVTDADLKISEAGGCGLGLSMQQRCAREQTYQ